MEEYIIVFVFFLVAMLLMLGALQFSKYKQRPGGSCGGDSCACEASGRDKSDCTKTEEIENKFIVDVEKLNI